MDNSLVKERFVVYGKVFRRDYPVSQVKLGV